ncbi:MAG: hypothetical protein AVDCRST_MAG59-883 [uncultured Thermomicrobiales bacterium]|uniref:Uncharacterized protein n=1 Tax=uncultured Thermomicrobiales bacterium TaxID=1645740 RepID=A0A6J4U673_9BACT|nr:MAG: hypothetical protein AVDCRST_MAG59-883 [uncultured Thermomicrobiales bacterium]
MRDEERWSIDERVKISVQVDAPAEVKPDSALLVAASRPADRVADESGYPVFIESTGPTLLQQCPSPKDRRRP